MKTSKTSAFTLIELLVVISIIAILAGIALPVFNSATQKAQQNKALQQSKGIFYGLKMFANDHDGSFPSGYNQDYQPDPTIIVAPTDANQAYMNLIPTYVQSENPFSIASSKYCKTPSGGAIVPANNVNSTDRSVILKPGVNTFAYVLGLSDTSNANFPIIADGFAGGAGPVTSPAYSKDPAAFGGVWGGTQAIVVRCDGSASVMVVSQALNQMVTRTDVPGANFFTPVTDPNNPWLSGTTVYNPAQP
jgi:prepilin-type N-terminal cleavage/methylation domain-containing protein